MKGPAFFIGFAHLFQFLITEEKTTMVCQTGVGECLVDHCWDSCRCCQADNHCWDGCRCCRVDNHCWDSYHCCLADNHCWGGCRCCRADSRCRGGCRCWDGCRYSRDEDHFPFGSRSVRWVWVYDQAPVSRFLQERSSCRSCSGFFHLYFYPLGMRTMHWVLSRRIDGGWYICHTEPSSMPLSPS